MALEDWIVRDRTGERVGSIRKLILDSRTRQIAYADVALASSETLVRVPWRHLIVGSEGIVLDGTTDEIAARFCFSGGGTRSAAASTTDV